jgi:hypothetical protein
MTLTRAYCVRDPETRKPTLNKTFDVKVMGDIDLTYYLEASCGGGSPIPEEDVLAMRTELEMRRMPKPEAAKVEEKVAEKAAEKVEEKSKKKRWL